MKKFLCMVLLISILLSCCACGAEKPEDTGAKVPVSQEGMSVEEMYGHIDQTTPIDGYYKIWNADGVKNMAQHPDGKFELLCNVDMGGAELAPIGEFTGTIKGGNFTISNFTLSQSVDGNFGFVGVNKGQINSLLLSGTFAPQGEAKHIGTLAGVNEGQIQRCTVTGCLNVAAAATDAVCGSLTGKSTGDITNTIVNVDTVYTAEAAATVAGIVGAAEGGKLEFVETNGSLEITGGNKKAALFVGQAKDMNVNTLVFVGEANSQDGKLLTNYFAQEENVTCTNMLVRDNSRAPEQPHVQEKRQKVADYMNAMATVEWRVKEDFAHTCTCSISACHGTFNADYTYYGPPYNHKASSLYRMQYCIGEDGYVKDFVLEQGSLDGYDVYIGSDCSSATLQALLTVGTEVYFTQTQDEVPTYQHGTYPVGEYVYDLGLDMTSQAMITKKYTDHNGEEVMYEAYAQLRMADAVVYWYDGAGHSRLCTSDAVVVRDENGKISPTYSYVLLSEQGAVNYDDVAKTYSSWNVNKKYTFDNLFLHYYLPITIKEFVTGEFATLDCKLENGVSDSRAGLTTGTITSNYAMDYVTMVITDDSGKEVFNHIMFPSVSHAFTDGGTHSRTRAPQKAFDLISFGPALQELAFKQGGTYHATITATMISGDSVVVNDFTFTNGQA